MNLIQRSIIKTSDHKEKNQIKIPIIKVKFKHCLESTSSAAFVWVAKIADTLMVYDY